MVKGEWVTLLCKNNNKAIYSATYMLVLCVQMHNTDGVCAAKMQ